MKPWVKLYTEINRDVDMGTLTWAQRGIWAGLLALAGDIDDRAEGDVETGKLDTIARTAWHLRCDQAELHDALAAFGERGMVEERDGVLYLPNYGRRQAKPPSEQRDAQAERQRKSRDAQARQAADEELSRAGHAPVTDVSRGCHADVTTENRLDEDLDEIETKKRDRGDRDEIESDRAPDGAPDSVPSQASDSISIDIPISEEAADGESPELEDAIRRWSGALKDAAAVESNLTQIFAIWAGYPQIRAPDLIRLVNETGTMVQKMRNVQKPMAYFFKSIRGHLERKLGPPRATGKAIRVDEPPPRVAGFRHVGAVRAG